MAQSLPSGEPIPSQSVLGSCSQSQDPSLCVLSLQHGLWAIVPVSGGEEKQANAKLYFLLYADTHKICLFSN